MKYVVICVYDREIMKVGQADSPTEATEIMKNDFMNVFLEQYWLRESIVEAINKISKKYNK